MEINNTYYPEILVFMEHLLPTITQMTAAHMFSGTFCCLPCPRCPILCGRATFTPDVLSVCGCVPSLCQLFSIYIELHDCLPASNLICFLFYSPGACWGFQLTDVLLVRKEAVCCRTTKQDKLAFHHPSHTMASNSEWRTVQRTNSFVLIKCNDSMSLAAAGTVFLVVRDYAIFYG